jgi:hypothetical protein
MNNTYTPPTTTAASDESDLDKFEAAYTALAVENDALRRELARVWKLVPASAISMEVPF